MLQRTSLSLKIIQPIVISIFTVLVLAASFLVGKHVGFSEGVEQVQAQQISPVVEADSEPQ